MDHLPPAARCAIEVLQPSVCAAARHRAAGTRAPVEHARRCIGSCARRSVDPDSFMQRLETSALHSLAAGARDPDDTERYCWRRLSRVEEMRYAVEGARLLVMHSDGLKTRWQLSDHLDSQNDIRWQLQPSFTEITRGRPMTCWYRSFSYEHDDGQERHERLCAGGWLKRAQNMRRRRSLPRRIGVSSRSMPNSKTKAFSFSKRPN